MIINLRSVLLIVGVVLLAMAAFNVPGKVSWGWLGAVFVVLAMLVPGA